MRSIDIEPGSGTPLTLAVLMDPDTVNDPKLSDVLVSEIRNCSTVPAGMAVFSPRLAKLTFVTVRVDGGVALPSPLAVLVGYTCTNPNVLFPRRSDPKFVLPFASDAPTGELPAVVRTPAGLVPKIPLPCKKTWPLAVSVKVSVEATGEVSVRLGPEKTSVPLTVVLAIVIVAAKVVTALANNTANKDSVFIDFPSGQLCRLRTGYSFSVVF
jgi:hypothetical protein